MFYFQAARAHYQTYRVQFLENRICLEDICPSLRQSANFSGWVCPLIRKSTLIILVTSLMTVIPKVTPYSEFLKKLIQFRNLIFFKVILVLPFCVRNMLSNFDFIILCYSTICMINIIHLKKVGIPTHSLLTASYTIISQVSFIYVTL